MARRILIICKGPVGTSMSSPGIRSVNMARVLSRALPEARVLLAAPSASDLVPDAPFRVVSYTRRSLPRLAMGADIVICQGFAPTLLPAFYGRIFVMDFFSNFMIEGLEYRREHISGDMREAWLETQRVYLNLQLSLADFVICSNERQRDAWLGMMSCLGLIPGTVYDEDATLRRLVAVAPYGIRPDPIDAPSQPVIRGVIPGIGPEDRIILWNGGILRWYDPLTLIRAVARLAPTRPDLRLLFLGTAYPVAGFDVGGMLPEAIALARDLDLLGTHVIFNEGWLPYDASGQAMLEADIGVSTYYENLETHFSYRTRLIDFLWAGTPVVCTRGDVIAEMVESRGLGFAVPQEDEDALTDALARLLDDADLRARCRANLAAIREELSWERALTPLVEFCRDPRPVARGKFFRTPDIASRTARYMHARVLEQVKSRWELLLPNPPAPFPRREGGGLSGDGRAGLGMPRAFVMVAPVIDEDSPVPARDGGRGGCV
ncbi:MAG: glycosyltransferase, partial [Dehalococcoidia bacterium]